MALGGQTISASNPVHCVSVNFSSRCTAREPVYSLLNRIHWPSYNIRLNRSIWQHQDHIRNVGKNQRGILALAVPWNNVEDDSLPSPGSVVFRRSAVQTHFEYATSLECLGLAKLSSELSRSLAISVGICSPHFNAESNATPVSILLDVRKERKDLKLKGTVRTAVSVCCNRCMSPLAEAVSADFDLVLTSKPLKDPTQPVIGFVLNKHSESQVADDDFGGTSDIEDMDMDDKLYFSPEEKEKDLSEYIRDTVHLEIPFVSHCSADCKGLCTKCGVNLNRNTCKCKNVEDATWGSLRQLKEKMAK